MKTWSAFLSFALSLCSYSTFATTAISDIQIQTSEWLQSQGSKGFIENRGQMIDMDGNAVPFVLFKAESSGFNFWISETGITLQTFKFRKETLQGKDLEQWAAAGGEQSGLKKTEKYMDWERIDIVLKGASIKKENAIGEKPLQGHNNYFYTHCPDGIYGVNQYDKVTIKDVYPGIDWVFYHKQDGSLKYDFIVHPGADYNKIELLYKSKTPVTINEQGELEQFTIYGNLKENTPVSFCGGETIPTQFKLSSQNPIKINGDAGYATSIKFSLPDYSPSPLGRYGEGPLIIDPQLSWATFYGGNGADGPLTMKTDAAGNVFVGGYTNSSSLMPMINPGGGTFFQGTKSVMYDAFILKFNNTGVIQWATYYGGNNQDVINSLAIDGNGNVFVTGRTSSTGLPVLNPGGGAYYQAAHGGGIDNVFILKFTNAGVLLWGTYFGGNGNDRGVSIATDASGNIFVTGTTFSNLPVTVNPGGGAYFQAANGGTFTDDVFILKFNNAGVLLWSTYYGGSENDLGYSIATDASGNVFVTGSTRSFNFPGLTGSSFQGTKAGAAFVYDAFILKFTNAGVLQWATYFGGSNEDRGFSIGINASGNVFVTGCTNSTDFPVINPGTGNYFQGTNAGGYDAFILKLNTTGTVLWATYFGGSNNEYTSGTFDAFENITFDNCDNLYFSFETESTDVPLQTSNCDYNDNSLGGISDQFITRFSNSGALQWSTYFGGNGKDFRSPITMDAAGNFFLAGEWTDNWPTTGFNSATYPLTNPGGGAYYQASLAASGDDVFFAKFDNIPLSLSASSTNASCVCSGIATVTVTGACSNVQYTWYDNLWNSIGTNSAITNLCAGNYAVEVKDSSSCKIDTAFVNIASSAGSSINVNKNINICSGSSYTLPGGSIVSITGIYTNTLAASSGCDSIITTHLTVGNPINTSGSLSVCAGQSVSIHGINQSVAGIYTQTFTAAGNCDSISSITLNVNNISTNTITISTCNNYTHNGQSYSGSGIYTQTLINTSGCDSILTIDLTLNSPVSTMNNTTICSGQTTLIHGVSQNIAGVYTQTYTAVNGCDSISTITLLVNGVTSNTITSFSCSTYSLNGQTYSASGVYTQTLIGALGCDSILTIDLTIGTPINTSGTEIICAGQSILIHGLNQNIAGIYTQTYSAINGCDSISSITLIVNGTTSNTITPFSCSTYSLNGQTYNTSGVYTQTLVGSSGCDSLLTINLTIGSSITTFNTQAICSGQITFIHGVSRNTAGIYTQTYSAINDCDSISSITLSIISTTTNALNVNACNSYTHNSQTYTTSGVYTQTLVNAAGCDSILNINLIILNSANTSDTLSICPGQSIIIHGQSQNQAGIYSHTFAASNGCDSISSVTLKLYPQAIAAFQINPQPAEVNTTVNFNDQSTGANHWVWNFGDIQNSSSTNQNPIFIYTQSGQHQIQLVVQNLYGCNDTAIKYLYIEEEFVFYAPNAFTPDEDGINDFFMPKATGLDIENYELYIFDRWGNEIFKSVSPDIGWDGKANGGNNIAQIDTYVWVVMCKDIMNVKHKYIGHVNLIR